MEEELQRRAAGGEQQRQRRRIDFDVFSAASFQAACSGHRIFDVTLAAVDAAQRGQRQ